MTTKIKICLDDPEVRAIWNAALRAQEEVASWPAWKRGEDEPPAESKPSAPSQETSEAIERQS